MTVLARREAAPVVYPAVWGAFALLAVLIVLGATTGLGRAAWLTGAAYGVAAAALLARGLHRSGGHRWGPADSITLLRVALTGGVTALVAQDLTGGVAPVVLAGVAALSLLLDAGDGQVARRTRTTSAFGARFDMEADSVLALVLSLHLAVTLGWWALALGLFRYAFGLAARLLPWLTGPLPPRMSRKVVAASQGALLVALASGLLPAVVAQAGAALAVLALTWSFGLDIRVLFRNRQMLNSACDSGLASTPTGFR